MPKQYFFFFLTGNQEDSDPEVILIKSKPLEEGGSTGKAACLARNFYPKNINLDMLPAEVIYEQNTPIVTSEGTYNTIKVVNVTKASEVSCTAKFKGNFFTANATSSGTNLWYNCNLFLKTVSSKTCYFSCL